MNIDINNKEIDALVEKLNSIAESKIEPYIDALLEAGMRDGELLAKSKVPVDTGKLKQSISIKPVRPLLWQIQANEPYAPYIEFGTGLDVSVPEELTSFALQFKGQGIRQVNIEPQPYLYPGAIKAQQQTIVDLKKTIKSFLKDNLEK